MSITDLSSITTENERPSFDRLKFDKQEKKRVLVPSTRIAQFFVHVFHNDTPEMKELANGRTKPEWDTSSFAGGYICTGDVSKVAKNPRFGDPEGCAACRAMQDSSKPQLVEYAKKTFAMNALEYTTKPNSYDVRNRNVEVKVWKHGDASKIQPIQLAAEQMKKSGKEIKDVDFLIECGNDEWKKLNINPDLAGAAYLSDEKLKATVEELIENELYPDEVLIQACGRQVTAEEMEAEVNALFRRFGANEPSSSVKKGFEVEEDDSGDEMEGLSVSTLSSLLED